MKFNFKFLAIPLAILLSLATVARSEIQAGEFYTSNSKAQVVHFAQIEAPAPSLAPTLDDPAAPCLNPDEPADTRFCQFVQKGSSRAPRSQSRHRKPDPDPDSQKLIPPLKADCTSADRSLILTDFQFPDSQAVPLSVNEADSIQSAERSLFDLSSHFSRSYPPGLFSRLHSQSALAKLH